MKGKHSKKEARDWDTDDTEPSLPILTTVDKSRSLHCYSAVLSRGGDEVVSMEELDGLQAELEAMLSAAAVRQRTLQAKVAAFNAAEETKRGATAAALLLLNNKKRKLNNNDSGGRVSKSMKDLSKVRDSAKVDGGSSGNESDKSGSGPYKPHLPELPSSKGVTAPKNDAPNKFWAMVEPYCAPVTQENIKDLEEMIASCEADEAGVKIPPLGKHYTARWADEDMMDEKEAGSGGRRKPGDPASPDARSLLKKASNICRERTVGPLVQRLVSALMEENLVSPLHESFINNKLDDGDGSVLLAKLPTYHTTSCFERRIRRELEAVGLIEEATDEVDEILAEIKKCDEELKIVASQNKEHLKRLLVLAKREIPREEIRAKIKAIDAEILKLYRKITTAKVKEKQMPKKVEKAAWKALKDREALLKSLDAV